MRRGILVVTIGAMVTWGATAVAQNQPGTRAPASKKNPYAGSPLTWGVEPIIDNYVSQMTRYYNLTPDQEEYTRQLLNQRVKRFLNDYEKDVRTLFAEYWYLQLRGEAPSVEEAKDLARRGGPLIAAIKKEILDGNQKWREILDENQRKIHDRDLEQMHKTFDEFEQRLDRWSKGIVEPTDIGQRKVGPRSAPIKPEDAWDYRVSSFIAEYNLDAGQQGTARSILRELKDEAKRYRERNQEKLTALNNQLKEMYASEPKTDPEERKKAAEEIKKINERLNEVERPIREDLWRQLLMRLERIPTEDQRRMHREKQDRMMASLTGRVSSTRTASQPESTRPATNPAVEASAR
ncbi:MAG: hypothetical protein QUV05_21925 [Phycisphaerae bacterium]|nr:hypothetical protein [Phycisphaerae bacterium]